MWRFFTEYKGMKAESPATLQQAARDPTVIDEAYWITENALAGTSIVCEAVLEFWLNLLGLATGDAVLNANMARRGAFLTGGILPQLVKHPKFFGRYSDSLSHGFLDKGPDRHRLEPVPVYAVDETDFLGVRGAAIAAVEDMAA